VFESGDDSILANCMFLVDLDHIFLEYKCVSKKKKKRFQKIANNSCVTYKMMYFHRYNYTCSFYGDFMDVVIYCSNR